MRPRADPTAVVDHAGRVHGMAGLRVVDASINSDWPARRSHCTVVAVAEKLADTIDATSPCREGGKRLAVWVTR